MVHASADCAIDGTGKIVTITISNADGVAAGSFTFYTLNQFNVSTSTAQITSATSKVSTSGENIDKTAAATSLTLATSGVTNMTSYTFYGVDANGDATEGTQTTAETEKSILVIAQVSSGVISGYSADSITVRLPFTSSTGSS
jgi:hypothetical protein